MGYYLSQNDADRLFKELKDLREKVTTLLNQSARVALLEEDPAITSNINLWMLHDGRLRGRRLDGTIMEYATTTPKSSTTYVTVEESYIEPVAYLYAYSADWQQAYGDDGASVYDNPAGRMFYGDDGSGDGEFKTMMHFPNLSELVPLLGNVTIDSVELILDSTYTYLASGTPIKIGLHSEDTAPASFVEDTAAVAEVIVPNGSEVTIQLPVSVGEAFRDELATGLTINQDSTAKSGFGYADAASLRIAYTK